VWKALKAFGVPLHQLEPADLAEGDLVFEIGVAPSRIDILTDIGRIGFDEAWQNHVTVEMQGLKVLVIGREELIRAKREAGRPRDLADLAELEGG
jgi:hypothetical protein